MKLAAAKAISELVADEELVDKYVIPYAFDLRIAPKVAKAVAKAAIDTGVARNKDITPEWVEEHTRYLLSK